MILAPQLGFHIFWQKCQQWKNASNENNANNVRKCLIQLVLTSMSIFPFEGIQSCNILQHHSIYQINIDIYQYSIYQINMSAPPSLSVLLQACREEKGFVEQSWDSICGSWTSASHLSDNHHFHFSYLISRHF